MDAPALGRRRAAPALAALAALALHAPPVAGQVIAGRVLEDASERPLATAIVRLLGSGGDVVAAAESGRDGAFRLEVGRTGRYLLTVELLGYQPARIAIELPVEERVEADILLTPRAVPVEPVIVEGEARDPRLAAVGYYERRERNLGLGIDREEIEGRHPRRFTDLLQGKARTRVVQAPGLPWRDVRFVGSEKVNMLGVTYCWPTVVVDGIIVRRAVQGAAPGVWLDEVAPPPTQIEAAELFRSGLEVPSRFGATGADCGVIAIWTRR